MRSTCVRIDSRKFKQNLELLKVANGRAFFCPMVKANGYGHGMVESANLVASVGADAVGVALVEEGAALRRSGFRLPILVFAPLESGDVEIIREHHLTPVLTRMRDFDLVKSAALSVHIKINSGMQRLGFDAEQVPELKEKLKGSSCKVDGVCTHFSKGEEIKDPHGETAKQFAKFLELSADFPGVRHAHKSATLAAGGLSKVHPEVGARPGISIYGLPYEGAMTGAGLLPVLSWHTRLTNVHQVERGASVSYGGKWTAARRSTIGVVPMGYADGYSRTLTNKGQMLFRGHRVPVTGVVCMDYVLLDLTDACGEGEAKPGEEVVAIGRQMENEITAHEVAERAGTIAYEVVTRISARVAREVV